MVNTRKVNARILELGLTQEDVAKQYLGIDPSTFNLKLNNKRRFYLDEVDKLCKLLNINTRDELKAFFGLDFLIIADCCENERKE